jgi:hypothetical protein
MVSNIATLARRETAMLRELGWVTKIPSSAQWRLKMDLMSAERFVKK